MKLTGHKTESVYRRYAIVAESDQREGVAKLAVLHAAQATVSAQVVPLAAVAGERRRPTGPRRAASRQGLAKSSSSGPAPDAGGEG
jgi:hypothetical protein